MKGESSNAKVINLEEGEEEIYFDCPLMVSSPNQPLHESESDTETPDKMQASDVKTSDDVKTLFFNLPIDVHHKLVKFIFLLHFF